VVTANKLLYWEINNMLWSFKFSYEHLDLKTWEESEQRPGGHKMRARRRQEGLKRFKNDEVQVLVLNLLVSYRTLVYLYTSCMLLHHPVRIEHCTQVGVRCHRGSDEPTAESAN
jgi:hypothetical protein